MKLFGLPAEYSLDSPYDAVRQSEDIMRTWLLWSIYVVGLAGIISARLAWGRSMLGDAATIKLIAIFSGMVACGIVAQYLNQCRLHKEPRGFEVIGHEQEKSI